jgi:hypothetical protein
MSWDDVTPIVFDIETCGLPNAADYLEPVQPAKNLKDPEKVKADIEQRTAERDAKLALDWNVGRIVAMGWWTERGGTSVMVCEDEQAEAFALDTFWALARHRTMVGFAVKQFDLRYMVQRSRLLEVPYPSLDLGKYSRKGIADLYLDLTFNEGTYDQGAMRRTLKAFAKRFGIPVNDDVQGADIPALVAAGQWDQVVAHVTSDVEITLALARKLGHVTASALDVAI